MPTGSDQSPEKRRSRVTTGGMGSQQFMKPSFGMRGAPADVDEEEDYQQPMRQNTSSIRLDTQERTPSRRLTGSQQLSSVPMRRQRTSDLPMKRQVRNTTQTYDMPRANAQKSLPNVHWLLPLGVGMMAMLVLWVAGSWVLAWGIQRYDDLRYGYPRTYQTNAIVGHGNDSKLHPSHFIAVNLNRQVVIIELMAGDPAKSVSYVVPYYIAGEGADLVPVTLEFRDVTGDRKPDMIIHIHLRSQDQTVVFVNDGTRFRPSTPNDKIQLTP